jgi:hypothetical protein
MLGKYKHLQDNEIDEIQTNVDNRYNTIKALTQKQEAA